MQFIFKILVILFLTFETAYASFEVYPMKLQISIDQKYAILHITNRGEAKKFSIVLRDCVSKDPVSDLSFSPAFFNLNADKTQAVRIALKPGKNYLDKQYILVVNTNQKEFRSNTVGFRIPITITDSKMNLQPTADLNEEAISTSSELTRIKISVPVIAKVR